MLQSALLGLVSTIFRMLVVTCWRRHNSRWSRIHHLVCLCGILFFYVPTVFT